MRSKKKSKKLFIGSQENNDKEINLKNHIDKKRQSDDSDERDIDYINFKKAFDSDDDPIQ